MEAIGIIILVAVFVAWLKLFDDSDDPRDWRDDYDNDGTKCMCGKYPTECEYCHDLMANEGL